MPLSFAKAAYQRTRRLREKKQDDRLEQLALIEDPFDQIDALLEWWPQKLPRLVKREIPRSLYKQWLFARQRRFEAKLAVRFPSLTTFLVEQRMVRDGPVVAERLHAPLERFWKALLAIKGDREVTTTLRLLKFPGVPEEQLGEEDFAFVVMRHLVRDGPEGLTVLNEVGEPAGEYLDWAVALGMSVHGSVVIRQALPMKAAVTGEDGAEEWVAQLRVYGIALCDNDWEAMPADAMRHAYVTDPVTGDKTAAIGVSFGEIESPPAST